MADLQPEPAAAARASTAPAAAPKARASSGWSWLGPGLLTGASDDDPSGIGTYAQAGAAFGTG